MRRREFIAGFGSAAAWPLAARAQQRAMPVVGYLNAIRSAALNSERLLIAFRQGLGEAGFVEGRNVAIEYRSAEEQNDRLPALAADLVRRRVAAIFAVGIPATAAAKAATSTIPIVFIGGFDPVAVGFTASLARPGGNLTGVTSLGVELAPKRLELLHELLPTTASIALLVDPANPVSADTQWRGMQAAAATLGLQPHILNASSEQDFENAFATLAQLRAGGLVISNTGLFNTRADQLGALALRHAVPTIFQSRDFAAAGGLMSYGETSALTISSHLAGSYVGRILKGEQPGDLPVQQATRVELIINMKAAKALGLTIPLPLLGRADEVIE
jgi:putative ABC transport system substrate-binding protein